MRIAICSAGELYGGVEQFIYLYAQRLQALDHVGVIVILFYDGLLSNKLRSAGIETHVIPCRFKYDPWALRNVARILLCRRIDVVHTHGYRANVICALATASGTIPVVKTEHGKLEVPLSPRLGAIKMYLNMLIDQLITSAFVNRIVYVTFDLARKFRAIHRFKSTSVIHNGIAPIPPCSTDRSEPFDKRHFNIGIVGRVSRIKGHMFLLSAVERLSDIQNLQLHIIGSGPLEHKLRAWCISRGMESKVRFWGFREDIHHLMRNLDVLVMPSLYEALPYTVLEAMYLRVPIVASDVGGLREILSNGQSAILVPPGNPGGLAAAIHRLHDHPEERQVIVKRAFVDVTSRFMIADKPLKYMHVYRASLLRLRRRRSATPDSDRA